MFRSNQLRSWLKILFIMGFFSLVQAPLNHHAFGGMNFLNPETLANPEKQEDYNNLPKVEKFSESLQHLNGTAEMTEPPNLPLREDPDQLSNRSRGGDLETKSAAGPKVVYLTIDDGPGMVSDSILDILAQYNVKATFFLLEPRIRDYAGSVRRMADAGHQLGVHGITHNVKCFYASSESALQELNQTRIALQEITGRECLLARTPYGSAPYLTKEQHQAATEQGYRIWDWNVDSKDWSYRSKEYVPHTLQQVERISGQGKEAVILIHELESTARYLPDLLESLLAEGYEFRVLDNSLEPVCFKGL